MVSAFMHHHLGVRIGNIANFSYTMLRRLYLTVTCTPPSPITTVNFATKLDTLPFDGIRVRNFAFPKWLDLPHITTKSLPEKPTDIRGIDTVGFLHIQKKGLSRKLPTVLLNKFFILRFVHTSHYLSITRKSNIAYTFGNNCAPILNDRELEQQFKKYRGPYRNLTFFLSLPQATETAVSRVNYRRCVKRSLFQALHAVVPNSDVDAIQKVSGIYLFTFLTVPITPEDVLTVQQELKMGVKKILHDQKYRSALAAITAKQNADYKGGKSLKKDMNVENTLREHELPGYFPKLPYLDHFK